MIRRWVNLRLYTECRTRGPKAHPRPKTVTTFTIVTAGLKPLVSQGWQPWRAEGRPRPPGSDRRDARALSQPSAHSSGLLKNFFVPGVLLASSYDIQYEPGRKKAPCTVPISRATLAGAERSTNNHG